MSTNTSVVAVASGSPQSECSPSPRSLCFPDVSIRGTRSTSKVSNSMPPSLPKAASLVKKKRSSVFSFFTVKEPSTQAWLDYQESLRKQQPERDGRISTVGLAMVSSAKLPPTVPKVNSRWDGVPDSVIQREKEKKTKRCSGHLHAKQLSNNLSGGRSMSRSSSQSSRNGRRTPGSTLGFGAPPLSSSSAASSGNGVPWTPSRSSADEREFPTSFGNSTYSGPETPLSEISSSIPNIPESVKSCEDFHKICFSDSTKLTEPPTFNASSTSSPRDISPATPQLNPSLISPLSRDIDSSTNEQPSQIRTTVLTLPPHQEQVVLRSIGPNILAPPMSSRRKPNVSAQALLLPESQPASILRRETTHRKTSNIARSSISDYFSSHTQGIPDSDIRVNTPQETPKSCPPSVSNHVERGNPAKSLTPIPQASKGSSRKSKLSFFKS